MNHGISKKGYFKTLCQSCDDGPVAIFSSKWWARMPKAYEQNGVEVWDGA